MNNLVFHKRICNSKTSFSVLMVYKDNQVYMRCSTINGKSSDFLNCDISGDEQEIGFNSRFFISSVIFI